MHYLHQVFNKFEHTDNLQAARLAANQVHAVT